MKARMKGREGGREEGRKTKHLQNTLDDMAGIYNWYAKQYISTVYNIYKDSLKYLLRREEGKVPAAFLVNSVRIIPGNNVVAWIKNEFKDHK